MQNYIKDYLTREIPITVTPELANQLVRMVMLFEIRDEHPLTLNSQMIGVNKFLFTPKDRQLFFDIIGYEEEDVTRVIHKIPSINKEFKVVSDACNIMSVYLAHLILDARLSVNLKHDAAIAVLNYMQYKLIGSVINHYFPHGATFEIMQTVVEGLNMKFLIKRLENWKRVVEDRSESLAFDTRAHHGTLNKFDNDHNILYLISDTSTRIRSQLKIITAEYYSVKETNNFITSHSSTASLDGEKVLREKNSSFGSVGAAVFNKVLIKSSFIDERYIKMVQQTVPRLNVGIIRRMLVAIADEARHQMEIGVTHQIKKNKDGKELYLGIETLIEKTVHVIYTSAIRSDKVNINSKISIYSNTRNIATASRSSMPELLNIKATLEDFLKKQRVSSRESTVSGLVIIFTLYIALLSFSTF